MRHLHGVGGQKVRVPAELRHPGLEGVPRARGFVEEHQEDGLIGKVAVGDVPLEFPLEVRRNVQHDVEFRVTPFLRCDPVPALKERFHG